MFRYRFIGQNDDSSDSCSIFGTSIEQLHSVAQRNHVDLVVLSSSSAWQRPLMIPQELFLIRHAITDMDGTLCGQSDPPLNSTGRAQASALANLLRGWNVRRLYASDLQRALQTAEALGELWDIPVQVRTGLREISFGHWEGRRWSQIRAHEPDIKAMELSPELCAPGGEAFACFRARVLMALQEIVVECNGHLAAIVTHLGVMRIILKELSSADCSWEPQQRIDHCSVYRIRLATTFLERATELSSKGTR